MGAGVATVGRRRYAVGLYWQPSPSGRVSAAAKEAARQPGQHADYFAARPGNKAGRIAQFGLGQHEAGHRLGMPTLAATLANRLPGSWAGAFKVNEGLFVVVVRDDLIAPDGDQLYIDEAEARDRLVQEATLGGLERIYAPEPWAIPGSEPMALPLVLQNRAECPLQPVQIPRNLIIGGAVAVALLVAGLVGYYFYQDYQAEQQRIADEAAAEAAREQMGQQGGLAGQAQIKYPDPIRYWEQESRPLELINACRVALSQVPQAALGWNLGAMSCNASGLSVAWARQQGFTRSSPAPQAVVDVTGSSASLVIPLQGLLPRGAEKLPRPEEITRRYLTQNWPGALTRAEPDPKPLPPPEVPADMWNPPDPPWEKRGFSLNLGAAIPAGLPTYFGDLTGVIIQNLTNNGGDWTADGVIYEERP